jgi:uncharacterized membrane protein
VTVVLAVLGGIFALLGGAGVFAYATLADLRESGRGKEVLVAVAVALTVAAILLHEVYLRTR